MLKTLRFARCHLCEKLLIRGTPTQGFQPIRLFSAQDASAALRPFYFVVHPDLFGQHPVERAVNENSLKILNEFLAGHPLYGRKQVVEVVFYIRSHSSTGPVMKKVKICLATNNLRETVVKILAACGLSDAHVPESTSSDNQGPDRPIDWHPSYYTATGKTDPKPKQNIHRPIALTLRSWLKLNIERSRKHEESVRHIQDDIAKLKDKLQTDLGLQSITFDSVWGFSHFRGCLKSFDRLYSSHPNFFRHVFKGRVLVFSNNTGVSRLGEIVLSSEDVPQTWVTLLQRVPAYDAVLSRLPMMEAKLSSLLHNISVLRREKRQCRVMAEQYELLLNKLLNSLRRCQDHVTATFKNSDLSSLQLVVEGESSPLMLSSLGQFVIPASVPGALVVDFINENIAKALGILETIEGFLQDEEESKQKAIEALELAELQKDESVTPAQMISCCTRLAEQHWRFGVSLTNSRIWVSHYYSVMQDGQICVPWDWIGDDD